MSLRTTIEQAQNRWQNRLTQDGDLQAAWNNITQTMFRGNIPSLVGAAKLIAQMDWWDGLSEWLMVEYETLKIQGSIHLEERSLYAFVLLQSRQIGLETGVVTWLSILDDLDPDTFPWGEVAITAGSLPTLGEIPDWLMEPIVLGATQEVQIPLETDNVRLYMQRFPVTQALFEAIVGDNPSTCLGQMHPVDSIDWNGAITFCNALSEAMGYEAVYTISDTDIVENPKANGYRLPTVEQWERAAQFQGNKGWKYAGHSELWQVGVYDSNTSDSVGRNLPTKAGIYDMSGNVWEWCWNDASSSAEIDPLYAIRKGGSWISKEEACAIDFTSKRLKTFSESTQGFRLCRTLPTETEDSSISEDAPSEDWGW